MAIRIVVAHDTDLVILGAEKVLQDDHRLAVVGRARCFGELIRAVREGLPDVVLLSETLYQTDILTAMEQVRIHQPRLKLIVLGGLRDGLLIRDLLAYGINGYLYASDDLCDLLTTAVHIVMRDRPYLSPTASAEYLVAIQARHAPRPLDAEARQVLQLLAQGETVGRISAQLGIAKRRVYWVRQKLRQRFGAKTNEHLIQRAAEDGFVCFGD